MRKIKSSSPFTLAKASSGAKTKTPKKSQVQTQLNAQFKSGLLNFEKLQITPRMLKNLSFANPFVAVAINKIKQKVAKTPYLFRAIKEEDQDKVTKQIDYLYKLFKHPNDQNDTFRTIILKAVDDMLVYDHGVWEKVKNLKGEVMYLYHVPGYTIYANRDEFGNFFEDAFLQFMESAESIPIMNGTPDATFEIDDLMIFQANPSPEVNHIDEGVSPVRIVLSTIVAGIQAMIYNTSTFSESALPPLMVNLKGVETTDLLAFKQAFEAELKGNPHSNGYTNAEELDVKLLRPNNQEMQFYELNLWLARVVISAFDLSPQDFGLTMDVNKATSETQERVSKDGSLATYLDAIAEEVNNDLLGDMALTDPAYALIEFAWDTENKLDALTQANIDNIRINSGVDTVNEIRAREGKDPLPEYEPDSLVYPNNKPIDEMTPEERTKVNKSKIQEQWHKKYLR